MKNISVTFYLKDKNSKNFTPIFYSVNTAKRTRKSTGLSIEPIKWNHKKGFPKTSCSEYTFLEIKLKELEKAITAYWDVCLKQSIDPTPEGIAKSLQNKDEAKNETKKLNFFERADEFISFKEESQKELTVKKYRTLFNTLKEFEKFTKFKISFGTINESFEAKFKIFSSTVKQHLNDTIDKNLVNLKVFMNWSLKHKYHNAIDYKYFGIKKNNNDPISLSLDGLKKLINLDLQHNLRLSRVRDMFCLQCLTGQRFSDINDFKWTDIIKDSKGNEYWKVYQKKGDNPEPVEVPLINLSKVILKKQVRKENNDLVFNKISNQKYNDYIEELCQNAGINDFISIKKYSYKTLNNYSGEKWGFISSHSARRTFVTVGDELGIPIKVIMKITGHRDYKTLKRYLGTSKGYVNAQFSNAWSQVSV